MASEMIKEKQEIYDKIQAELKDWHKILKKYQVPSMKKAMFHTAITFLMYVSIWILQFWLVANSFPIYWVVLIAVFNGLALGRIFIIQHDCGHKAFTPKKWVNNTLGTICSFFTVIPYKYWAKSHDFHHAHNGQLETSGIGDVECLTAEQYDELPLGKKIRYRIYRNPLYLFVIGGFGYVMVFNRFAFLKDNEYFQKVKDTVKWDNILFVIAYLALGYFLGWKNFLLVQIINLFFFGTYALWFFYIQHQYKDIYKESKENWDYLLSGIRGSTFYKVPRFFQFMTGNIVYHHIHHLSPSIPFYNLRKCSIENPIFQKYCIELSFTDSLKTVFANLWDPENLKMISFKDNRRRKQAVS